MTYYYLQCFYCQGITKNLDSGSLHLYFHIKNMLIVIFKSHSISVYVTETYYTIDVSDELSP